MSEGNSEDPTSQPSMGASEGQGREGGRTERGRGSHQVTPGGRGSVNEAASGQPPRGRGHGRGQRGGRGGAERPTGAQMRHKFGNGVNGGDKTNKVCREREGGLKDTL